MISAHSRPDPAASDGFNLVILMISVSILNILLALALPAYSTQVQRRKEAELIFRGLQYAEAVRVYRKANGDNLPTQLRQLMEVQPRSIRKLWKNPMDEEGRWCQIPAQSQPGGQNLQNIQNRQNTADGSGQPDPSGLGEPLEQGQPKCPPGSILVTPPEPGELDFNPAPSLPFAGVSSPVGGEAFRSFMGSEEISEWRFTWDVVSAMQPISNGALAVPVNSTSFWRPFPPGVTPPNPVQQPAVQGQNSGNGQNRGRNLGNGQNQGQNRGRNLGNGQNQGQNQGRNQGRRPNAGNGRGNRNN